MSQTTVLLNTKQKVKNIISCWDLFLVGSLSEMTVVKEIP